MNRTPPVSDEMQSAWIDGQLDADESAALLERMGGDSRLRDQVCRTRLVKEMVRAAYRDAAAQPVPLRPRSRPAAAALLAAALLGVLVGWQAYRWLPGDLPTVLARAVTPAPDDPVQRAGLVGSSLDAVRNAQASRVLVHVASADWQQVGAMLDGIEALLRDARDSRRTVAVEVIANIGGIDLLRASASPYPSRIATLQTTYPELSFIACGQTLERLRERGTVVQLLPGVGQATSALDQVVRRLQQGWVYVKA